jgi:hypothetical protein
MSKLLIDSRSKWLKGWYNSRRQEWVAKRIVRVKLRNDPLKKIYETNLVGQEGL